MTLTTPYPNSHAPTATYNIHIVRDGEACVEHNIVEQFADRESAQKYMREIEPANPDDRLVIQVVDAMLTPRPPDEIEEYYDPTLPSAADLEKHARGYQQLLNRAWDIDDLTQTEKFVFFAIFKHCWFKTWCSVNRKTLAKFCSCSVKSVERALPVLKKKGYLDDIIHNHNHASTFKIPKEYIPNESNKYKKPRR